MRKLLFLSVFCLLFSFPLHAEDESSSHTVSNLLRFCEAPEASIAYYLCEGKIMGIGDMMWLNGGLYLSGSEPGLKPFSLCAGGQPIMYKAMSQAFLNWAHNHPEDWSESDTLGVVTALRSLWPCK